MDMDDEGWADLEPQEVSEMIDEAERISIYIPFTIDGEGMWLDINPEQGSELMSFADEHDLSIHASWDGSSLLIGGGEIAVVK